MVLDARGGLTLIPEIDLIPIRRIAAAKSNTETAVPSPVNISSRYSRLDTIRTINYMNDAHTFLTLFTISSVLRLLYISNCCCVIGGSTAFSGL